VMYGGPLAWSECITSEMHGGSVNDACRAPQTLSATRQPT
jgi:hypothetical protein